MTLAYIIDSTVEVTLVVAGGGCVFYFLKGALRRSSESGNDMAAGAEAVLANGARIRCCAAWAGVMQAIELGMQHVRHVNGPLNIMVAWGAANAILSMHRGPRAAVREGLKGAAVSGAVGFAHFTLVRFICSKLDLASSACLPK
jgi:hypothetical protein